MPVHELTIDPVHSTVEFAVTYAMNTIVKGQFRNFSGTITIDTDDPSNSTSSAVIQSGSVDTGDETRDGHLRSDDFLDVESNEDITFESNSVEVVGDSHWQVSGDLTIGEITRPVTLDTHYYGIVEDATGISRAGFVAETDIHRSDWGLTWNREQTTGVLVSDRIRLSLYVSAIPAGSDSRTQPEFSRE